MLSDIRYGLRQLRRNKLFSAALALLLALGIGANALIFSLVNALLLKPLPIRNPENLYLLEKNEKDQLRPDTATSYTQFKQLSKRKDLFSGVVAETEWSQNDLLPLGDARARRLIMPQIVSPNYFQELGVRSVVGRVLTESDASATSNIPVVLSYQFWESEFNRNPAVVGQTIRLKKYPFLIVGVLPREFHSIDIERAPDIRLPISAAPVIMGQPVDAPSAHFPFAFQILVRLAVGIPPSRAAAAASPAILHEEERYLEQWNHKQQSPLSAAQLRQYFLAYWVTLEPMAYGMSQLREQFSSALRLLMAAVVLLLALVCANIAGLLLAKSEERRREIAVRLSLGASRLRVLRQLLSENLLIALPGALLGIGLAYAFCPAILGFLPAARGSDQFASPRILSVTPDLRVVVFALAACAFCVLLFGVAPALRGTRLDLHSELKESGRTATAYISGGLPVAVQIALSVLLLSAACLIFRTFWNLEHLNPGFDRAHILGLTLDPGHSGYSDKQAGMFYRELRERVAALPGVRSVAYSRRGLMRGVGIKMTVSPQGVRVPRSTTLNTSLNIVSPSFFETMGTPLLAGRHLEDRDTTQKIYPVVINRALANSLFPHENPIGKLIVDGIDGTKPPQWVVVGLVATAKYRSMREPDPPTLYELFHEDFAEPAVLYVRTFGDPALTIAAVRSVLEQLDPSLPILEVETLEQEVQNSLWQERLVMLLLAFFGVAAVLLAALGLYAALAYSVARRTRELGIRIAIGAHARHVVQTICARLAWSLVFGIASGVLASLLLLRITRSLLFGISPLDPASFVLAALLVVLFAVVAAAFPSRRALKTDPAHALREE